MEFRFDLITPEHSRLNIHRIPPSRTDRQDAWKPACTRRCEEPFDIGNVPLSSAL